MADQILDSSITYGVPGTIERFPSRPADPRLDRVMDLLSESEQERTLEPSRILVRVVPPGSENRFIVDRARLPIADQVDRQSRRNWRRNPFDGLFRNVTSRLVSAIQTR
jgi:hypothetical protein